MNNSAAVPAPLYPYHKGLHLLAVFLTVWTFFVVVIGGSVKSHEAGLSIPEPFIFHWITEWWNIPNLKWEFFHRMLVGILGVGVFVLMLWTNLVETRPSVRFFSWMLLLGVVVQAVFGWMTVRFFAHWPTSIPHAALGQAFLGMMACMAASLAPQWVSSAPPVAEKETPSLQKLAQWNLIAVFVQLLLGAAIRHDDHGKMLQAGRDEFFYWHLSAHILGAITVCYFLARVLFRVFRDHRQQREIIGPARLMMMLVGVQFVLGPIAAILKVMYSRDWLDADVPPKERVWIATAHVAAGALILALSAVLAVRSKRYLTPISAEDAQSRKLQTRAETPAAGVHA